MFDVIEFKYRMAVARMSIDDVARLLGITRQAIYKRFRTGSRSWSIEDYWKIKQAFNLTEEEAERIFFSEELTVCQR